MVAWLLHVPQANSTINLWEKWERPAAGVQDMENSMHPALYALILGLLSGLSLPIGAWAGCLLSPVSDKVCGCWMAFGAGALLFAVTVELYGHALKEVHMGTKGLYELFATILGALLGAAFYLIVNRWLEEYLQTDSLAIYEQQCTNDSESDCSRSRLPSDVDIEVAADQDLMGVPAEPEDTSAVVRALKVQNKPGWKDASGSSSKSARQVSFADDIGTAESPPLSARTQFGVSMMTGKALHYIRGREKALRALISSRDDSAGKTGKRRKSLEEIVAAAEAKSVGMALFLGLLIDGVPEGLLIGFLAAEYHLTPVLVVSLFVSNFPEAFSASSLFVQAEMARGKIILMWTSLMILVGGLAGISCWILLICFPSFSHGGLQNEALPTGVLIGLALIEGITGGAMIACIAAVMLPESFERAGKDKTGAFYCHSGFLCTAGFLLSVSLKVLLG